MSNPKTYNQLAGKNTARIEALSDGVFAVALTLLVLDIKVPINDAIHSEKDLMLTFAALIPKLLTYFLSFMTLGIFWTGHSTQFQYIERGDRNLNWISLFFLLLVSVVPFTTAFLGEHITFKFAIGLYWLNILLLGIFISVHWNYAFKHHFINHEIEEHLLAHKAAINNRVIIAQILYAAGALLCFVNTYLSIGVIIAIQLNYAFGIFSGKMKRDYDKPFS